MRILSKNTLAQASKQIKEYGRPLERRLLENYFFAGSSDDVVSELIKYQNEDGGFGHGIESDFRLPLSSPMATSVGLRHLATVDELPKAQQLIKAAIGYLESTFNADRKGWFIVGKEVNDYPHAPWWNFNIEEGMTILDHNWGNPSAELLGFLYKYRNYVTALDVMNGVEFALTYIEQKQTFSSEHEIYCYLALHEKMPLELQQRLEKRLIVAINQLIVYDEKQWQEYVPTPLDFVPARHSTRFGIEEAKINSNLEFLITNLEARGHINPPWLPNVYQDNL
ncbi:MAG: hypothetical protein NUK65_12420, partial [Firmicutes bacterium]|nr:hypothetical protein [Bacillota bacterium]